jgi:type IV secretion system protein VirB5
MAKFKKLATVIAAGALATAAVTPAHALFGGAGGGAKEVTQVVSWAAQYIQMVREYNQLVAEYSSLNGIRGMADLVNNPTARKYLPDDYMEALSNGYGDWKALKELLDKDSQNLSTEERYKKVVKQIAIDEAMTAAAYKKASERIRDIQILLNKVNDAPDAKDIADLQGRIQAESAMLQNEQAKISMMVKMQDIQQRKLDQISTEDTRRRIKAQPLTKW